MLTRPADSPHGDLTPDGPLAHAAQYGWLLNLALRFPWWRLRHSMLGARETFRRYVRRKRHQQGRIQANLEEWREEWRRDRAA